MYCICARKFLKPELAAKGPAAPKNRKYFAAKMKKFSTYDFSAINLKSEVARRFRTFSRQVSASHTETMEIVLNFFEYNELSPHDDLDIRNAGTKKRINALIAIIKNIEKHQTRPTKSMLDTLFQEVSKVQEDEEDFNLGSPELPDHNETLVYYQDQFEKLQTKHHQLKMIISEIMEHATYVKSTFGTGHYKLDLDKNEYESIKQRLKNVYHHQPTTD